jgi:hypothetical protein
MRQGPRGVPSAATGKTSRPEELKEIAVGGSVLSAGSAATAVSADQNAARDSETSTSQ